MYKLLSIYAYIYVYRARRAKKWKVGKDINIHTVKDLHHLHSYGNQFCHHTHTQKKKCSYTSCLLYSF